MGYTDYRDPVRFTPPPPRPPKKFPLWLASAIVSLVLLLGLGYVMARNMMASVRKELQASLPPAAVHVGAPLSWRTLEDNPMDMPFETGSLGGLFIADFDADGSDEVLRVRPTGKSPLYEVDGAKSTVGIHGLMFMMGGEPWDYDCDGVSEILTETMLGDVMKGVLSGREDADDIAISQQLPVYDMHGKEKAKLPVVAATPDSLIIGDFDGDGWDDLLCSRPSSSSKYGSSTYLAIGRDGREIWESTIPSGISFSCTGDVDGDGRDELVTSAERMEGVAFYGMDQQSQVFLLPQDHVSPSACFDLDGDGTDEVLFSGRYYYNPASRETHSLTLPGAFAGGTMLDISSRVVAADILGDTQPEIIVAERFLGSYILIFSTGGTCLYYEEFGDMVNGVGVARSGLQDHLVVQCSEKLLVYP